MAQRCGFVAIVGRPNVGKSTLLNRILGQKISITSRKPQTTRYQILGIDTVDETQLIFVDTPGWQRQPRFEINRLMNRQVRQALFNVDCTVQVTDARGWHADDDLVYAMLKQAQVPALLAMNKHDLVTSKSDLLPQIAALSNSKAFGAFVPVCAKNGKGLEDLRRAIVEITPIREHIFPAGQLTDRSERFMAGEIIREKSMRYLGDELPYRTTVIIDEFREADEITHIYATVWVDSGQPEIHRHRKKRRIVEAYFDRCAARSGATAGKKGLPKNLGKNQARLDRQSGSAAIDRFDGLTPREQRAIHLFPAP